MKNEFGDPIEVEWIDAVSWAGWYPKEELTKTPKECYCKSRGFFVCEDKIMLVLANTVSEDQALGVQFIPKGWILSRC